MLCNVICYRLKEPIIYNKGTPYQSSYDTFLYKYVYADDAHTQHLVDDLNTLLEIGFPSEMDGLKMDTIKEFFASKQEEMY